MDAARRNKYPAFYSFIMYWRNNTRIMDILFISEKNIAECSFNDSLPRLHAVISREKYSLLLMQILFKCFHIAL